MIPPRVEAAVRAAHRPVCAYIYDTDVLAATVADLRAALPSGSLLCYAVKANSDPRLLAALADHVDGFEVASGGELDLAIRTDTRLLVFGGPGKTDAELVAAMHAGALINVESPLELRRLAHLAEGWPVHVLLRVNRDLPAPAGSHTMTGAPTPFGIDERDLASTVDLSRRLGVTPEGFHLHAVSNNLDAAAHAAYVVEAVRWAVSAARAYDLSLRYVNVGGGFGVDYTGGSRFDLAALRVGLSTLDTRVADQFTPRLIFEPGRFLVAPAGWYAAEVLDLKRNHGRTFAVLRGGTHHFRLPAAWGYNHPFTVVEMDGWAYPFSRPEVRNTCVDAVGELCTPRDVLSRDQPVDRLGVGDVLAFGNTGAYGWDISHRDFLRHPYPQMIYL
jgi:2-[(L-alanin-3-ylcarbamoyl)methyl]-2-hydroxybutanedioate decarboxylase